MRVSNFIGKKPELLQSSLDMSYRPDMSYQPEKMSLLLRFREKSLSGAFVALTLLAMAGWIYLLSSMSVRFFIWMFS
jgi:hypothetical protein